MIFQTIASTFIGHKGCRILGEAEVIMTPRCFLENLYRQVDLL